MNEKITNYVELARDDWINLNFGDKRLNNRAITIGESFLRNPFVSPPKMFKESKKLKAFYRFMDSEKVSHEILLSQHINNSKSRIPGNKIILAVQDSVTMTFKRNYEIEGLYDVGNIPGLVVHNTLSIIPTENYGLIDGLLHQIVHKRKPKNERTKEDNEIKLWMKSIDAVGIPPKGTKIVDVMDRAADTLEIMHHSLSLNHDFIIRAQYNRLIQ